MGLVSKGLLLKGDKDLELVLLASKRPTVTLLRQVTERLALELEVQLNRAIICILFILIRFVTFTFYFIESFTRHVYTC